MKHKFLILFGICSFFLFTEKVSAAPLDSLRESYMYYLMTSCTDLSNSGACSVLDSEQNPITNKTFRDILDILEPTQRFFLDNKKYNLSLSGEISQSRDTVILFPLKPTVYYTKKTTYTDEILFYNFILEENRNVSCYMFDLGPAPEGNELGSASVIYSDDCMRENINDLYSSRMFTWKMNGRVATTFLTKVSNFDLDDIEGNRLSSNTVNPDIEVPDEIYTESKSILENIVAFFRNITNSFERFTRGIKDFFNNISNFVYSNIIEPILEGIKRLFIPKEDYFKEQFDLVYGFLNKQLGFLFYPFDLTISTLERFNNLEPQSPIFNIPNISIGDFGTLFQARSFDLSEYVRHEPYSRIYSIYLIFVNGIVGFSLVKLAIKKEKEIVQGGI